MNRNQQKYTPYAYRQVRRVPMKPVECVRVQPTPAETVGACECDQVHEMLHAPSLAMVYSPEQKFVNLYCPAVALSRGTLFCELDKPFCADGRRA